MKLASVFKILKGPVQIERVRCLKTGFAVEGPFSMPPILQLNEEQQKLVELLVIHGGSLKKVAEDLDISYPTLKNRLDEVSGILKAESEESHKKRMDILEKIDNGEIDPDDGAEMLESL